MRLFWLLLFAVVTAGYSASCVKSVSVSDASGSHFDSSFLTQAAGLWQCFAFTSCPPNPAMEGPCYMYSHNFDTSGSIYITLGDSAIYRHQQGTFEYDPVSWLFKQGDDTLYFKPITDSVLQVTGPSRAANDTVKLSRLDDHSLVVKFVSYTLGTTYEIDSLSR